MASNQVIQYINPSNSSLLLYDGKHFSDSNKRENKYSVSRILYEDIIVYSFKIPSVQSTEDLSSQVEIKMYEEAGLDVNKTYKIVYLVKNLDFDEMDLVEAFAFDKEVLKKNLEKPLKIIKYIDFLALPFLAFSTLYTNKILTPKNDIFVYIGTFESFLSFYKDGSYISTKSLISLNEIVEKLNSQDINIDIEKLKETLKDKGLNQDFYKIDESELFLALEAIFSDILTKINNIAMHNRSIFGFDKIDRIFFSTHNGRVKGFKEFSEKFGLDNIEIKDFNLFRDKQTDSFLDKIVASYGYDKYIQNSNEDNVTVFTKPPSFFKTTLGKLVLSLVVFTTILGSVFGFFYFNVQSLKNQEYLLQTRYDAIIKNARIYKVKIKKKQIEIEKIKKDIKKQDLVFANIKSSISKLEIMKGKDDRYINFLTSVNKLLEKYNLKTRTIEQIGKTKMVLEVVSSYKSRDKIAKFLKALINDGFSGVKTKEIKLDAKKYISKIEIGHE
jgi:hypothetical protein